MHKELGLMNLVEAKCYNPEHFIFKYNSRDTILYSLGIGCSQAYDLQFLYENHANFQVFPTYSVVPCLLANSNAITDWPGINFNYTKILHGEQYIEQLKPLPSGDGELRGEVKLIDILDKGIGALIITEVTLYNNKTDEKLAIQQISIMQLGAGKFGGNNTSLNHKKGVDVPNNESDKILQSKAILYRQAGLDLNPLHIDKQFAKTAGFELPIFHGLGTMGIVLKQILFEYSENEIKNFKSIKVRFSAPVIPGQTLLTETWKINNRIHFQTKIKETGKLALTNSYVDLYNNYYIELKMADVCTGLMRPSDSWSSTEVRVLQHGHMWTIKGFSQCEVRYLETTVIVKDFANQKINFNRSSGNSSDLLASGSLTFKIRLHPQGNKESNKDFCFFQVFSCSNVTKFKAKFVVFNTQNDEIAATVYSGTQQLNGYFEYIRRDLLISHIQPQDEIQLLCNLTIVFDTVTRSSQNYNNHILPEPRPLELAHDLELMFNNDRHADFKIICQNEKESKEINVHKIILSARSPVFSAMFEQHTEEAQNNVVIFNDVDFEVMHEMLFYIYSGRSPALQLMAFDLLAAADRFQLSGLKEMADQILRAALTVDNVCRSLVLADMHNAFDLKNDAIRFIAQYSNNVIKTDGWNVMLKEHPRLVTEVVSAMSLQQEQIRFSTLSTIEPLVKRTRFDC